MKITDYLIIVATCLLSSFTFSSYDAEFKNLKEENGIYYVQFGVVGHNEANTFEVESILLQIPNHNIVAVVKRDQDFMIRIATTDKPNFTSYRTVFSKFGYELDNRFFKINNQELLDNVVSKLKKLRNDKIKTQEGK
jgi:hypothetical protein